MKVLDIIILLSVLTLTQVYSQTSSTLPPCNVNVPDSSECPNYEDACIDPVKLKLCQRHCGTCVAAGPSTLPPCVDLSTLCALRAESCSTDPLVQKQCCLTCHLHSSNSTATTSPTTVKLTTSMLSTPTLTKATETPTTTKATSASPSIQPTTESATTTTTAGAPVTTTTKQCNAVTITAVNETLKEVKITMLGYVMSDTVDKVVEELEVFLNSTQRHAMVEKTDVEDAFTAGGEKVTIVTTQVHLLTSSSIENSRCRFQTDFGQRLTGQLVDNYNGLYDGEVTRSQPNNSAQKQAVTSDSWSVSNWYVIFGIVVAALLVIGLTIMSVILWKSHKKRKLNIEEKKLSYPRA